MIPRDYQVELAARGTEILKEWMILYLAMEERTGKSLTAVLIAEQINVKRILIITKKKALAGWHETLTAFKHKKIYEVTNYHQAKKKSHANYDLIILDESHNYISSFPKQGTLWNEVARLTLGKPLIYLSATPHPQGPQMLYAQFKLSSWSPWLKYKNFYQWFNKYGKPYTIEINSINVPQYDRAHLELVLKDVDKYFVTKTRAELGFVHEPEDVIHWISLEERTKNVYNELLEHELCELTIGMLVTDTKTKLRTSLHQLEGGTIKIDDSRYTLANVEKIEYIEQHFGDKASLVIMYNFKQEKIKLEEHFKYATILQATSNAEGVDLHKFKDLVVYSQDYSTARHTQRRARQANMNRLEPIKVHFLLVKGAISQQVYKTVSVNKKNYVDTVFTKEKLK